MGWRFDTSLSASVAIGHLMGLTAARSVSSVPVHTREPASLLRVPV